MTSHSDPFCAGCGKHGRDLIDTHNGFWWHQECKDRALFCDHCDTPIDSASDPHCRIINPYDSRDVTVLCENCRERAWDRQQESLMETGGGPTLQEQQIEAQRLK